jgi:hypothetical protein
LTTTPLDALIASLVDASNAGDDIIDAFDAAELVAQIDAALLEAYRLRDRAVRVLEEDGPDPDRLRDEWLDDQWRSQ